MRWVRLLMILSMSYLEALSFSYMVIIRLYIKNLIAPFLFGKGMEIRNTVSGGT